MRFDVLKGVSLASVVVLPLLSLGFALIGRMDFWAVSSNFYTRLPGYLSVLVMLEVLQAAIVFFGRKFGLRAASGPGTRWIIWGVYQVVIGIALIQLFDVSELWLASTVPVYIGFASVVLGAYLRTVSADQHP